MAQTRMIDINDTKGHAKETKRHAKETKGQAKETKGQALATFTPAIQEVAAGDLVNWRNNTATPHWPAPKYQPANTWMDAAIPGKLPDQPAPTSQQTLSFSAAMTIDYVCALHEGETGTIKVV